jgi:transposase-like protein/IS1 family transposase
MLCLICQSEARKFGRDRHGNQRWQCQRCRKTFSDRPPKPLDEMHLPLDKAIQCLKLLSEGCSVRATVRLSGVAKDTVLALLVCVGEKCEAFLTRALRDVPVTDLQADEIWGFIAMKEKTKKRKEITSEGIGDAYCYVGIERHTKLVLAWFLGKRDRFSAGTFMQQVRDATRGRFQLTTDSFNAYRRAVDMAFVGRELDYAQLTKKYATSDDEHRYSPGDVIGTDKTPCCGNPDPNAICTSHVERHNLQMRMQNRRMTRLTNAFSRKWANHQAALGLYFAVYNYCRPHGTLTKDRLGRKTTPAMAAGLTDHPWTMLELLQAASTQS